LLKAVNELEGSIGGFGMVVQGAKAQGNGCAVTIPLEVIIVQACFMDGLSVSS